jgi:tRNA U54 and U55 pseudouridine synthase Pus10
MTVFKNDESKNAIRHYTGGSYIESKVERALVHSESERVTIQMDPDTEQKIEALMENHGGAWTCTVCESKSKKKSHLREHVEKHIEGLEYPCYICGKVMRSYLTLRKHNERIHKSH